MLDTRRPGPSDPARRLAALLAAVLLGALSLGLLALTVLRSGPAYLRASGGLGPAGPDAGVLLPLAGGLVAGGLSVLLLLRALLRKDRGGGGPRRRG